MCLVVFAGIAVPRCGWWSLGIILYCHWSTVSGKAIAKYIWVVPQLAAGGNDGGGGGGGFGGNGGSAAAVSRVATAAGRRRRVGSGWQLELTRKVGGGGGWGGGMLGGGGLLGGGGGMFWLECLSWLGGLGISMLQRSCGVLGGGGGGMGSLGHGRRLECSVAVAALGTRHSL